eukprot:scaffold5783_cov129-Amphora_coffeaeformis.AAC.3
MSSDGGCKEADVWKGGSELGAVLADGLEEGHGNYGDGTTPLNGTRYGTCSIVGDDPSSLFRFPSRELGCHDVVTFQCRFFSLLVIATYIHITSGALKLKKKL